MHTTIAINADEAYSLAGRTLLKSIASHVTRRNEVSWDVVVLGSGDWSGDSKRKFLDIAIEHDIHLQFFAVDSVYANLPLSGRYGSSIYNRFSLSKACPYSSRAIYMDSDMIALADIAPLLNLELNGNVLAAVQDPCVGGSEVSTSEKTARRRYFNSGLLVIDMPKWSKFKIEQACFRLLTRPIHRKFPDQDVLNEIVAGRWLALNQLWNVFHYDELKTRNILYGHCENISYRHAEWLQAHAYMLHYAGPLKPWRTGYPYGRNLSRFLSVAEEVRLP